MRVFFITSIVAAFVCFLSLSSCSSEKDPEPVDCGVSDLDVSAASISVPSGCTSNDGSFTASGSGGVPPYIYQLNNSDFQSEAVFSNLGAGTYTVTIKDEAGCSKETEVVIEGSTFTVESPQTAHSGCGSQEGSITITALGSSGYEYSLNSGSFQASNVFLNLAPGEYSIKVKDETGCEVSTSAKIFTGVSFESQVKPIIMTNCVISGCHDGNSSLPDWSVFSNVQANASSIKTRTQNGSMPKTGSLTEEEIDLIACWVDDGALNN